MQGGHDIRVFDNEVVDNDTPNFAPKGNMVAIVPKGMGIMVMANRNVHVFDNRLDGNGTAHVLIAAYPNDYDDDNYMFVPRGVYVHGNTYGEGGSTPDGEVGKTISDVSGTPVPDIVWDGVTTIPEYFSWTSAENRVYVDEAEGTSFVNLKMISQLMLPWGWWPDTDIASLQGQPARTGAGEAAAGQRSIVFTTTCRLEMRAMLPPLSCGHLPHKGGDWISHLLSPTFSTAKRARRRSDQSPPLWGRCPAGQRGREVYDLLPAAASRRAVCAFSLSNLPRRLADTAILAKKPPKLLSEFGFFDDLRAQKPAAGVVPFRLNTPLFSDNAQKFRFVHVPEGKAARYDDTEAFEFPVGTALIKTFAFPADYRKPR